MTKDEVTFINCCQCSRPGKPTRLLGPRTAARLDAGESYPADFRLSPRVGEMLPDGRALCRDCAGVEDDDADLVFDEAEGEAAGIGIGEGQDESDGGE